MTNYEFDVALSFAGEDRSYVQEVANALDEQGIRVFYDQFEQARLWGEDLAVHLDKVYRSNSRYVILFASTNYVAKVWTSHERRSAQARAIEERGSAYILPVLLDDTEVPGLPPTVGYLDGRMFGPPQVAEMVAQKLGESRADAREVTKEQALMGVPLTHEAYEAVVTTRPPGWEHLLLAGGIWLQVEKRQTKTLDHELGFAHDNSQFIADDEIPSFISVSMSRLLGLTQKMAKIIDAGAQDWALGAPGEPGDPAKIGHLCERFGAVYEELLDWSADIRGATVSSDYSNLLLLLSRWADEPIRQIREFTDRLVRETERIPAHLADPNPDKGVLAITIELTVGADEQLIREFDVERRKLKI
ncbi:TIR domain-containing protein [Micromonospora chalcea]